MMRQRPIPQKKLDEVTRLQRLVEQYKVIGLANLEKMPASSLQDLRSNLRKNVVIHVAKKRLIKRAFEALDKPNLVEFSKKMKGITALLFTNMDPIKLAKYLESKATKDPQNKVILRQSKLWFTKGILNSHPVRLSPNLHSI